MYFTLDEVAEMMQMSRSAVGQHAFKGHLRVTHWRCGRCQSILKHALVTPSALDDFRRYMKDNPWKKQKEFFGNEEANLDTNTGGEND